MMKKFTTTTLALTLIVGAVSIPFTSASNATYQQYLNQRAQQDAQYQTYSPSVSYPKVGNSATSNIDSSLIPQYGTTNYAQYTTQPVRNYRGSRENTQVTPVAEQTAERTFSERRGTISARNPKTVNSRTPLSSYVTPYENNGTYYVRLNTGEYAFQVPASFEATDETQTVFSDKNGDATLRIELAGTCSNDITACAVTASRHRNSQQGIIVAGVVFRENSQGDTEFGEIGQNNKVLTESFQAVVAGKLIFVSRSYITDSENNVYVVEFKTSQGNVGKYILQIKSIFDSVRIIK